MSLKIFKDGKVIAEAVDDRAVFIPTYESEKTKDPSVFNRTEEDREGEGGLTPK
jgi:hypothetical protein